jgi:hypothetical protein
MGRSLVSYLLLQSHWEQEGLLILTLADGLNDEAFVRSSQFLAELSELILDEVGQRPTLQDLCDVLVRSLQSCPEETLRDTSPRLVRALKPEVQRDVKITLRPGDLLAIDNPDGQGFHLIVFLEKNRFGYVYGVIRGLFTEPLGKAWSPQVVPRILYGGNRLAASGRWRRVARRPDLISLFPASREIHYQKKDYPTHDNVGAHGAAESPDGVLRNLSAEEAAAMEELDRSYPRQNSHLDEQVEILVVKYAMS